MTGAAGSRRVFMLRLLEGELPSQRGVGAGSLVGM